jgi:hypothetical protein
MRRAIVVGLTLAALAAPGDALAQAPTATYAGGFLPSAGKPPPGYQPTVGIALQPRGGQIAVRFDTTIRCGDATLDVAEQRVAPFDGVNLQMTQPLVRSLGGGRRLDATWTLKGSVAVTQASGADHLRRAARVGALDRRRGVRSRRAGVAGPSHASERRRRRRDGRR